MSYRLLQVTKLRIHLKKLARIRKAACYVIDAYCNNFCVLLLTLPTKNSKILDILQVMGAENGKKDNYNCSLTTNRCGQNTYFKLVTGALM